MADLSFNPPQDLRELTPEQNQELIDWFATLPLAELRQRQALCTEQQSVAWKMRQDHGPNPNVDRAMANLDITWGQLWRAVDQKVFGKD